jgi:hypothetical protein
LSLGRCLFLARTAHEEGRPVLHERARRLASWHRGVAWVADVGELGVAGVVRYDARLEALGDAPLVFGEPLPAGLDKPRALLDADPAALRALDGATAALAVAGDRACLVDSAGGPGMLYAASSGAIDAWSTHAVAAAWLATGRARVDPAAVPDQLAAEFAGGDRSLVEGARPLGGAVRIEVADGGARLTEFWPPAERWARVPEDEAAAHAERSLLETLDRRARAFGAPHASLTAGVDSRVVMAALRELGVPARGFTWGEAAWEDVRGGAEAATALGLPHDVVPVEWLDDAEAMREMDRQVRWTEGAASVGFARLGWPESMACFVTGAGGELGRAFYYRDEAPATEEADPERLVRVLHRLLAPRLAGARREATEALEASLRGWVDAGRRAGGEGWRTLDVVYGEQRVRRWLRGMLPRLEAPMIPAFATPEVARALASLPLADRLTDGFHRGFLERRAPELVPAEAAHPRRGRLRVARLRRARGDSFLGDRWDDHPGFREWVADGVLGSALLAETLGERWAARTRERFLGGDGRAEVVALAMGGVVGLDDALGELR